MSQRTQNAVSREKRTFVLIKEKGKSSLSKNFYAGESLRGFAPISLYQQTVGKEKPYFG